MKYNLAKELTTNAPQILQQMAQKLFGDSPKTARKFV